MPIFWEDDSHIFTPKPIPLRMAPPRVNIYPPEIGFRIPSVGISKSTRLDVEKMVLKTRNIVDYLMEGCGAGFNINTPLKFNIAPENVPSQKERIVFQPSFLAAMLNFVGVFLLSLRFHG